MLMSACARKAHTEKSITTIVKDSIYHFTDTSKMVVSTKITEVTNYGGDSLQAILYLPKADTLLVDSITSNGIKVGYGLSPFLGGYKLTLKASAKPVSTNKTTEIKEAEQKAVTTSGEVKSDTKTASKDKVTESKGIPWGLIILGILALLAALFIIYKYLKEKWQL
jgi:hypothetical protein